MPSAYNFNKRREVVCSPQRDYAERGSNVPVRESEDGCIDKGRHVGLGCVYLRTHYYCDVQVLVVYGKGVGVMSWTLV